MNSYMATDNTFSVVRPVSWALGERHDSHRAHRNDLLAASQRGPGCWPRFVARVLLAARSVRGGPRGVHRARMHREQDRFGQHRSRARS